MSRRQSMTLDSTLFAASSMRWSREEAASSDVVVMTTPIKRERARMARHCTVLQCRESPMRIAQPAVALLLFAVSFAAAGAETVPIPRAGETIDVSIVNLDVIVTDSKGNHVLGLTASDFEVFEDGKPQAISNFAQYVSGPKATVTSSTAGVSLPPSEAPQRERRTIAIFIEDFHLPGFRVTAIFDALKKTLHEVVAPGDAILIATWKLRTKIVLDYTDNLG